LDTAARAPQAFRRYVGLSVGLHAGLLAIAATLAAARPPPALPAVVPVTLLAGLPGGPPAGAVSAPPPSASPAPTASPPPAAAPAPKRVVLPKPPAPRALPPGEPPREIPPAPAPREVPPAPPEASAAELGAGPALAPTPSGAGGCGAAVAPLGPGSGGPPGASGGGEGPIEAYAALVRARIEAQRRYSPMARRRGLEGVVMLRLQLAASGEVAELLVEDGAPLLLARSTEDAVARAGPFPPPPTGLGVLRIPVRYRLTD
jgi:periplasmic protein TonB